MAILIGINDGQSLQASAGRRCPTVSLTVKSGIAIINARRINIESPNILVLWHARAAGTFKGWLHPEAVKTTKEFEIPRIVPQGVLASSSSGGHDIVAAVVTIPEEGLVFKTADRSRGTPYLHVCSPDGKYEYVSLERYQSRFNP